MKRCWFSRTWRAVLFGALLSLTAAAEAQMRTVTDMAGHQVRLPRQIRKVYCMNPACAMTIYSLAPERLQGWAFPLSAKARSYLAPPYNRLPGSLPMAGTMGSGSGNINVEQVMKMHPDVIMFMAPAGESVPLLDQLQKIQVQTHIPTYLIDMRLNKTPEMYERLGQLFGLPAQAKRLADYSRHALQDVEAKTRNLPDNRRPRVYFADGPNGLQTYPVGSAHAESIELAGGYNVARGAISGMKSQVSQEQILQWNPDIILVGFDQGTSNDQFFQQTVWNDPLWKSTRAVRHRMVFKVPPYPYGWVSAPSTINRILGVKWLAQLLHPELFHYDMVKETKTFYALFYHHNLTDAELHELLDHAHR